VNGGRREKKPNGIGGKGKGGQFVGAIRKGEGSGGVSKISTI